LSAYEVRISPTVQAKLDLLRAFDHVRILEAIEEKLTHEPLVRSRNRKPLEPTPPTLASFVKKLLGDTTVVVWELRVVPWRVAYAVEGRDVHVLHVFRKDQETTDDALS
jgi:mRNA-degrading endonuclease RelE of RelBE toxin-antitoxin system